MVGHSPTSRRNGKNDVTREDLVGLIQALQDLSKERNGEIVIKAIDFLLRDDFRYNNPPREGR